MVLLLNLKFNACLRAATSSPVCCVLDFLVAIVCGGFQLHGVSQFVKYCCGHTAPWFNSVKSVWASLHSPGGSLPVPNLLFCAALPLQTSPAA
jgi:ABC-type uncharacterized transport system permease subunit